MTQGNWASKKSPEEVRKIMSERGKQNLEKRKLAFQTLRKVEHIKQMWKESEGKWSRELKECIVSNLFD